MQLKFHPFFLVTCLRSAFVKRLTSVGKLSPEIVFWIEFVNLSITKSRYIFFSFFTIQRYEKRSKKFSKSLSFTLKVGRSWRIAPNGCRQLWCGFGADTLSNHDKFSWKNTLSLTTNQPSVISVVISRFSFHSSDNVDFMVE